VLQSDDVNLDQFVTTLRVGPKELRTEYPTPLQLWTPTLSIILEVQEEPIYDLSGIHHPAATRIVYLKKII